MSAILPNCCCLLSITVLSDHPCNLLSFGCIFRILFTKVAGFTYCISSSSKNLSIVFRVTHTVYFIILYTYPVLVEYVPILTFASIINAYLISTQLVNFLSKVAPIQQFLFDAIDLFVPQIPGGGGTTSPSILPPPLEHECNARNYYITISTQ